MDYTTLTNEELDRISGTRIMGLRIIRGVGMSSENLKDMFCPTNPDSNQAERYLFPVLLAKGCTVIQKEYPETEYDIQEYFIHITANSPEFHLQTTDKGNINRTKTIACLMAWDKLEEQE